MPAAAEVDVAQVVVDEPKAAIVGENRLKEGFVLGISTLRKYWTRSGDVSAVSRMARAQALRIVCQ